MKITSKDTLKQLTRSDYMFKTLFEHGTLFLKVYKSVRVDFRQPHTRDKVYFIKEDKGEFVNDGDRTSFGPGDFPFVPSVEDHCFENFTDDFSV